jgi:hypothetical protein
MSQVRSPSGGDSTNPPDTNEAGDSDGLTDDHLVTTQMPTVARPPVRVGSALSAAAGASSSAPPGGAASSAHPRDVVAAAGSTVKTAGEGSSWWRALLQSTRPDAMPGALSGGSTMRLRIAIANAALALILIAVALAIGLRDPPSDLRVPAIVSAAIVVARALVAVGLMACSTTLLRVAERLFAALRDGRRDDDSGRS